MEALFVLCDNDNALTYDLNLQYPVGAKSTYLWMKSLLGIGSG